MRASQFFLATLKEAPQEAELPSHKLMLRGGLIRKLGSGLYSWLPMGMRVLHKVERIVREEMDRAGALEVIMPPVQPAELWQETGRWDLYGPMMLRIKDRAEREFCYAPTAEEVITDIARKELRSYRQLPVNFYQIQTKFRDEIRPRFGVLRAREFSMKDAYSFDADEAGMLRSYQKMFDAYVRIFTRLGLKFRPVAADTGEIGGLASHEFQVLADSGEDQIAYSDASGYAANIEQAEAIAPASPRAAPTEPMRKNPTPGTSTCEGVAKLWNEPLSRTVKAILLYANHRVHMLLIRGDHTLNEVKTGKVHGLKGWRWASDEEILAAADGPAGYLGPVGLDRSKITVVADRTVAAMSDFICGANEKDFHIRGVNWGRDCPEPDIVADIRNVIPGDPSPDGKGTLAIVRGIEVGHVFALGRRYSEAMGATFTAEDGTAKPFEMGCYGIGVTRIVGAAIEQNHDDKGIIWPDPMAPFTVAVIPMGANKSEAVKEAAEKLYAELLAAGIEAFIDDRGERPGVMLADQELVGIPHRVVIGERGLKEGVVEYQHRRDAEATKVPLAQAAAFVKERLAR
ncbi:MAG: proline--tRNA ligase [Betaproteobacteria bacterium]|nr:proline--tRNA ligase [Betaproteobacteria bacterium]PWB66244.1 MAG: proline--tRNA ligase [Betaproteobacteria bacterium]